MQVVVIVYTVDDIWSKMSRTIVSLTSLNTCSYEKLSVLSLHFEPSFCDYIFKIHKMGFQMINAADYIEL